MPLRSRQHGFTLVELIVVVGIIVVLVSIMVPVMQSVRAMANVTTCAHNQKAIGVAVTLFCSDHGGVYPTTIGVGWRNDNWIFWQPGRDFNQSALAPYMGGAKNENLRKMFICPSQPVEDESGFQGGGQYTVTYAMNYAVSCYYPLQMHRIKNAQQSILMYDENMNADDDQFWYQTDRDTLSGRHGTVTYQSANLNGAGQTSVDRGLGNVLFVDGHVGLVDNNYCHKQLYNDLLHPN